MDAILREQIMNDVRHFSAHGVPYVIEALVLSTSEIVGRQIRVGNDCQPVANDALRVW